MGDVDVDEVLIAHPARPPHRLDELTAGEGHVRAAGEGREDVELGTGQRHGLPVDERLPAQDVDAQWPERRTGPVRPGVLAWAPQHGPHPGDELTWAEGLGDVVIGANREPDEIGRASCRGGWEAGRR